MNKAHAVLCSSGWWARTVKRELLPWGLADVDLGENVLEIGPGFGATTRVLARRRGSLTVLELSEDYCKRLRETLEDDVEIVQADATDMPFVDGRFSGVVCFTMLHHVPSPELQDRLMAEVSRVLRPGGIFAGTDSLGTGRAFKLLHVRDTLVPVSPDELPARLRRAGLIEPHIDAGGRSFRFQARKPPADATTSPPSGNVATAS
ncbi:MAG TPA: class I SAM-dependent methyltransferase [Solirubrobacteraceae bacterium]|jgi:SAM-dependent methyltransferase|nr:class I SAM-dependent methyltransferase [Solirubrobacteraceae bacterium]